jgi:1,4-alpha-glucan branching enzyme
MWGHPGKKLLFMGGEFAQEREWNHDRELDWHLVADEGHRGVQNLVRDLNRLYRETRALHQLDCDRDGFRWIVGDDAAQSVIAFERRAHGEPPAVVVCNFTPVVRHDYRIGVDRAGPWRERLNSDAAVYGGSNVGNGGCVTAGLQPMHGYPASLALTLPPLATLIFTPET